MRTNPTWRGGWILAAMAAGLLAWWGTGCVSVVRGDTERLVIHTSPEGANVLLSTGETGVTPYTVEVARGYTILVTLTKPGYKELKTALVPTVDREVQKAGSAAGVLFLPIISDVVDYKTGSIYSHKPNPLSVTLIPANSAETYPLVAPPGT